VNGTARFNLAILNSDGSLDTSFEPPLPSRSSDTLTGVPSSDGSVWVTGTFTNLGGQPRNRFARLLANGSVDPACPSPFTATNSLTVAAVQPDGRVLVAGNFHAVAGAPMEGVVRLNPDGSVDNSFQSALAPTNHLVRAVLQADGRLVAAVTSQVADGIFIGPQRLIRLNVDGSLDAAYHVDFNFVDSPTAALSTRSGWSRRADRGRGQLSSGGRKAARFDRPNSARWTLDYCFDVPLPQGQFRWPSTWRRTASSRSAVRSGIRRTMAAAPRAFDSAGRLRSWRG